MGDITENTGSNPIVFLDITVDEERVGRIVIELFRNICPRTAENFRALCTGERGIGSLGKKLHFKDSIFHKVVPECLIQGGDITNFDGTGGESIYGPIFEDENFIMEHRFGGELSMANRGIPHSNNSQFCITTAPCFHLNGAHVVFGKVLKGLDVAKEVSYVSVGPKENPLCVCKIADCGELKTGDDWGVNENDGTEDKVPLYPNDWDKSPEEIKEDSLIEVTTTVKNSGNHFFKNGKLVDAIIKYKKALRYITWYKAHLRKTGNMDRAVVFKELELHCNLNCALVKVKKGYYREALTYCAAALSIDSQNVKAICRRAQANFGLNNYDLALEDYKLASSLAPNLTSILNGIRRVKKAQSEYLQFEKITYAKMLNSA